MLYSFSSSQKDDPIPLRLIDTFSISSGSEEKFAITKFYLLSLRKIAKDYIAQTKMFPNDPPFIKDDGVQTNMDSNISPSPKKEVNAKVNCSNSLVPENDFQRNPAKTKIPDQTILSSQVLDSFSKTPFSDKSESISKSGRPSLDKNLFKDLPSSKAPPSNI